MDLQGGSDLGLGIVVADLSVYQGNIYFAEDGSNDFCKMNPETLEKEAIYNGIIIVEPIFYDGYLFFSNNRLFKKMSLETREVTELTDGGIMWNCFYVIDDYVYFNYYGDVNGLYSSGLCKIKTDGTGFEILNGR